MTTPTPVPTMPRPETLWAVAGIEATLITEDSDRRRELTGTGQLWASPDNGWWTLAWIAGGRAVLCGLDLDYSKTEFCPEPVDLLAGGPDWLPWSWLADQLFHAPEPVGFVYWWDGAWAHARYPAALTDDGAATIMPNGDEELLLAVDWLAPGVDETLAQRLVDRLIHAATTRTVDRDVLTAVQELIDLAAAAGRRTRPIDLDAALRTAERAGLTPGSTRPELPAGHGEPGDRLVPFTSDHQHGGLVTRVMREAGELDRPAPTGGPALDTLLARLRAQERDGRGELVVAVVEGTSAAFHIANGQQVDPALAPALQQLWQADHDPDSGHWLYLRVRFTADTVEVDRAYDHMPEWWQPAAHFRASLETFRREMARRDAAWRPDWAALLPTSLIDIGIPPGLCAVPDPRPGQH